MTPKLSSFCPHAPTDRQAIALVAHRFLPFDEPSEVFYGGAAGGGKSDWLLMAALEHVDVAGYAAIIFRKTFTDLSLPGAIMARAHEWLANTDAHWTGDTKQWQFPSGASLQFAYLKDPGDELRYQSAEFQFVGFDELTQFDEEPYTYLFSRLRRPADGPLSKVPLRMCAASNPGGRGHGWVKRRFPIDGKPRGQRVFVPAKISDNQHLDRDAYRKSLSRLGETLRQQLEEGDWTVAEGLAFTVTDDHLIDRFELGNSHDRFEALDYGLNGAPWALWAVDYEGNVIAYDLLYVRDKLPSQLAPLVQAKRSAGWGQGNVAYADPAIWHRTGQLNKFGDPAVLADEFADCGVPITKGNNDPRAGLIRVREMLKPDYGDPETGRRPHLYPTWHPRAGQPGSPRVFFVRGKVDELITELRDAPLQPIDKPDGLEKIDPEWESRHGHAVAMCRYALMSRPDASEEPEGPPSSAEWDEAQQARAEYLWELEQDQQRERLEVDYSRFHV